MTNDTQHSTDYSKWIGVGFIIGVLVAVLALEYYGYLKHSNEQDRATIDEFSLLSLGEEYEIRVSPKSSGKQAICVDGYLLLRPTNGQQAAGILVDSKNRGIHCLRGFATTSQEAAQSK